ncbi:hypothetical protein [Anaeromicropila herbilytica]|uniref:Uncharacterized protein n=1 Tax=Anaeromicropila herbilytica TaxID=2785025 RepID=A0A7R7EP13_9FIRM|nr:hypothetical protein [Anaeromicropila herbilytica]BCN32405.1 hypothetical protein bsdtb5_37000 [Anaeromicropila herbilytica]BCN32411.1 hypothetical protein bsdtb5_37060 [Anaeromicropila herbilytica]
MNSFSKIVALFIAVLLLFIVPILYLSQKQDAITQSYVAEETTAFVDAIKNNGYVTDKMYTAFLKKLDDTNNIYTIKIEHSHQVINPVYDENTGDFQEKVTESYKTTYEDTILKELYEGSGIYKFDQGDYISVKIVNRNKTFSAKLQQIIYAHEMNPIQIYVTYGGTIRDENY